MSYFDRWRLAKKWNEADHPRHPAGAPKSQGGEFRPVEGGSSGGYSGLKEFNLHKDQVPDFMRGGYNGTKFQVKVTERMELTDTSWSGGTRSTYSLIDLSNKKTVPFPGNSAPRAFGGNMEGGTVNIKPGYAVAERVIFQGKDLGIHYYVHPDNATKLLPSTKSQDLSVDEQIALRVSNDLKSSYRFEEASRTGMNKEQYEKARASLRERGLLRANNAITVDGRNAARGIPKYMNDFKRLSKGNKKGNPWQDKKGQFSSEARDADGKPRSMPKKTVNEFDGKDKPKGVDKKKPKDNDGYKGSYRPVAGQIDHEKYPESLKGKTEAQLKYIIADAKAAMKAMPDGPKAGYYADEVNYAAMELNRRKKEAAKKFKKMP